MIFSHIYYHAIDYIIIDATSFAIQWRHGIGRGVIMERQKFALNLSSRLAAAFRCVFTFSFHNEVRLGSFFTNEITFPLSCPEGN